MVYYLIFLLLFAHSYVSGQSSFADGSTCAPGMVKDEKSKACIHIISTTTQSTTTERLGKACEFGMGECPALEECVPIKNNNRSRVGACKCQDEYVRNPNSGICEPKNGTSTSPPSTTTASTRFAVKIIGPATIQLPNREVNLTAAIESGNESKNATADAVKYSWTMRKSPLKSQEQKPAAVLEGRENETVHLRELNAGEYEFAVRVTFKNQTAEAHQKLTVLPEKKSNAPPVAVVQPPSAEAKENTQIILDGSGSRDTDGKIKDYMWTQVDGPVITSATDGVLTRTPALTLQSLQPGNYSFKLTVTDDGGLQGSAMAHVHVTADPDYPPKAVAGSCDGTLGDVAVRLPIKALYLCGNKSTDDKGIMKWKWTLKDTSRNTADMEGTGSAMLKVSNLRVGDYTFTLMVEDKKGQTSSADVHVVVMPAVNKPPVANAGQNQTVVYPETSAILDGSLSSDDKKIASYLWSQIEGPSEAVLQNADKVRMTATGLQPGIYVFELNVTDDGGLSSVDHVSVIVDASNNRPPVAVAADVTVSLPCNMAILNGSASTDDAGVVRWLWSQHDNSPAGLDLLGDTWQQPILRVSSLSLGIHVFNLTVFDKQGATGFKLVKLNIIQSSKEKETVEAYFKMKFSEFTMRHQRKLVTQLKALLETSPIWDRVDVNITKVTEDPTDGSTRVLFYAAATTPSNSDGSPTLLRASTVAEFLETHSSLSEYMTDFTIRRIDSLYCQNNCSGRGYCEQFTKRCICDRYWMPNLFAFYSRAKAKDCDWSVLYFVMVILIIILTFTGLVWLCFRGGARCRLWPCVRAKTGAAARRIRRYRMLKNEDSPKGRAFNLKALKGRNGHRPVISDSDISSEDETIYDRSSLLKKEKNGSNGVTA